MAALRSSPLRALAVATGAVLAMVAPALAADCLDDPNGLPRCAAGSHSCDAGGGPASGSCQWHGATQSCDCVPKSSVGYTLTSSAATARVHPADSASIGIAVTPVRGFRQDVNLTCQVTGAAGSHDVSPPTCSLQPARIASGSGGSTLAIQTTSATSADRYVVRVDAADGQGQGPQDGPLTLDLDVLLNGGPITYTQTITPSLATLNPPCPAEPSGSLGALNFTAAKVVLTFTGNTANVVPFLVQVNPGRRVSGFENLAGTASVVIQDPVSGTVLGQATFLPPAGIFVSADNGNSAVGFGSFGVLPQDPTFPGEPVYPYGLVAVGLSTVDLKHGLDTSSIAGADAVSCIASNPAASAIRGCTTPKPLPTSAGDLLIVGSQPTYALCHGNGSFTATPAPYPLTATLLVPDDIVPGSSATSTVTVGPLDGYTADVTLSCSVTGGGAPAPSCSLQPNVVKFGSGTATLTVSTSAHTPLATYSVAVTGADVNGLAPASGPRSLSLTVSNSTVIGETGGGGEVAVLTLAGLLALWHAGGILRRWRNRAR